MPATVPEPPAHDVEALLESAHCSALHESLEGAGFWAGGEPLHERAAHPLPALCLVRTAGETTVVLRKPPVLLTGAHGADVGATLLRRAVAGFFQDVDGVGVCSRRRQGGRGGGELNKSLILCITRFY